MQSSSLRPIRIGTRGSPLALAQAHAVRDALAAAANVPADHHAIVVVSTVGDRVLDRPLAEIGGKGLFTREIEDGLRNGSLDVAVHSAKDMETATPGDLAIAGYLPREDARDVLVSRDGSSLDDLPRGAVVGTASLRRAALLLRLRPDLTITTLRGNVQTRLGKLAAGGVDATLLALAGLKRLGLEHVATEILATDRMLPAVGQGAIALEIRAGDGETAARLAPILCRRTGAAVAAERAYLAELDGSCRTPIAGHAEIVGGRLLFRGMVLKPDGSAWRDVSGDGDPAQAAAIGAKAGQDMRQTLPPDFLPGGPAAA